MGFPVDIYDEAEPERRTQIGMPLLKIPNPATTAKPTPTTSLADAGSAAEQPPESPVSPAESQAQYEPDAPFVTEEITIRKGHSGKTAKSKKNKRKTAGQAKSASKNKSRTLSPAAGSHPAPDEEAFPLRPAGEGDGWPIWVYVVLGVAIGLSVVGIWYLANGMP